MKRKLLAALLTLAAALSLATLGVSEEKAKAATEAKDAPLYGASCPSPCDFSVKSHDKAEVVAAIRQHAKAQHNMDMTEEQAAAMVKAKEAKK